MNTAQTTKNLAKTIAKQIAQEPLEILKTAREQIASDKLAPQQNEVQKQDIPNNYDAEMSQDKLKSQRIIEAFDRELKDMAKEKLFKELQRRIAEGDEVYIDEYSELSMEQKQVLKAQKEAVEVQKQNAESQNKKTSFFGSSKPSRRFGQKQQAQKEQTRVEKPVPPSG